MDNIVICTTKEWNIENYFCLKKKYEKKYNLFLITEKNELSYEQLFSIKPKFVFFPHWSWMISEDVYNNFECIVFHMTDLPYGRGGSPFQNLIMNEVYDTKISALKVIEHVDAGDIYLKEDVNISTGSAEENFIKISSVIFEKMIPLFFQKELIPKKQVGEVLEFKRRISSQSDINTLDNKSISKLYDFIRMLDARTYPKAYLELDNIKIEFSEVNLKDNKLVGRFEIKENE